MNGKHLQAICGGSSPSTSNFQFSKLIKWVAVSIVAGSGSIYLYNVFAPDWRELQDEKHYYSDWKLRAYCSLPLNAFSRFAGYLANVYIPVCLRRKLFGMYVRAYDCRMDEAEVEDLSAYPTLAAFFNRSLKPRLRPVSDSDLVSPADAVVIHYGKVNEGRIEFVKGHDYDIVDFLGPKGYELYQMVLYLAPGNYHGFHAPANWLATQEIHFPGLLLSVRPTLLKRLPHVFCINERVVLKGSWKHGFFSMSAVAATNVGDISIEADPLLHTNVKRIRKELKEPTQTSTELEYKYRPGDKVGEFRLGSTIVLIFEAPPTVHFAIHAGDNLRYGQSLIIGRT
ncbi:unnamed protein product [Thelazia callipaeda]|uniref:phosphatidylserine decarboxylase n=1 Tax=Thelazia callipaeda TaxID=103827 RepID=A0A0N5CKC6_THECL|nr:unnamed protein product [Thelazia callipaeda]